MKKIIAVLALGLLLTGCGGQMTLETVLDTYETPVTEALQVEIALPDDAALATIGGGETGKLYLCDGYSVTVQTMGAGDLDRTLRQATGFAKEQLTVMQTQVKDITRYDCVWSALGEEGEQTCRGVILDDGCYHYVVTVMADAQKAGELTETWKEILQAVTLINTD